MNLRERIGYFGTAVIAAVVGLGHYYAYQNYARISNDTNRNPLSGIEEKIVRLDTGDWDGIAYVEIIGRGIGRTTEYNLRRLFKDPQMKGEGKPIFCMWEDGTIGEAYKNITIFLPLDKVPPETAGLQFIIHDCKKNTRQVFIKLDLPRGIDA